MSFPVTRRSFLLWAGAPALASIAIIWFPFGLSMGGLIEEWDMLHFFDQYGLFWHAFPGQPTSEYFAARPLTPLPFLLARLIDDRSFLGLHVMLMAACAMKVVGGASIGYTLFRNRPLALALGLLLLVYPADTQQISLRNIHINLAVALMVCAAALALRGVLAASQRERAIATGAAIAAGIIGTWVYEPVLTLYSLFPLFLWSRLGTGRTWRLVVRRRWLAAAWIGGAAVSATYLYYVLKVVGSAYQTALAGGSGGGVLGSIAANGRRLLESGGTRAFVESWASAWEITTALTIHWAYPLLIACLAFVLLLVPVDARRRSGIASLRATRFVAAGLVVAAAGYLPYLVSESHVEITQRTFLALAPGAALVATTLIAGIARLSRLPVALVATVPITLGLMAQTYQHDRYARAYISYIRPYLEFVAARSDESKRVHLVFDTSGVAGYLNGVYFTKLAYGLPVIRRAPDDIYVLCRDQPLSSMSFFSNCRLEGDRWVVTSFRGPAESYLAADTDVIPVGADFAEQPSPSSSWRHHATFDVKDSLFRPVERADSYECTAESMWGYSGFCPGLGWSDGTVVRGGLMKRARFFALAPEASLIFAVRPAASPYKLRIRFSAPPPAAISGRWHIALNGSTLDHRWLTPRLIEASVPGTLLVDGRNELQFHDAAVRGAATGLAIERIALVPVTRPNPVSIDAPPRFDPGARYLCNNAFTARALEAGFSDTEHNGTWTDGPTSTIRFSVQPTSRRMVLKASVVPFLNEKHQEMSVEIAVNNVAVVQKTFNDASKVHDLRIPLPQNALAAGTPISVRLDIRNPASPAAVGEGGHRWLGLFFKELEIVEDAAQGASR